MTEDSIVQEQPMCWSCKNYDCTETSGQIGRCGALNSELIISSHGMNIHKPKIVVPFDFCCVLYNEVDDSEEEENVQEVRQLKAIVL